MKKVIGHNQAKKKLMNNLSVQSWLVCGKKGIGKATLAKSFSNWLLIKNYNEVALDLHIVEGDTIGIEKVREMKNFLHLSPIQSEHKIAIIDSLEAMTNNAKNAILKILEEPPKNSKIFIISHKPYDIQTTILCRCFQLNLLPLTYDETKQVVSSQCKSDDQTFDEMITLFPGMPGMIINAISSDAYEAYKCFYKFLHDLKNPNMINKVINSEIELELASYIIQAFILGSIKKEVNDVEILLGNEFFEYKKYDPQYSGVSDEYKFVDFGSVKKTHNLKFKEYVGHAPKFFAAEGPIEPGSQNHAIDLFRLVKDGKGSKVGTLADEFGYFDDQNKLHYYNYHKSAESNIYNPENFSIKMINIDVSKIDKFYLIAEQGDIIIHPILENLDIF
ncbi:uncharacterized protein TNCT_295111 [Trichonephila clavata]|uniref:DNA polymerase III subunit delta n=1 Tax=Trichonephila clavata TaxID=2740835 RepID=A0A8X6FZV0_TRICU|nr:uncharacterized protein TNCT_295111 [Trichonephila clavata]